VKALSFTANVSMEPKGFMMARKPDGWIMGNGTWSGGGMVWIRNQSFSLPSFSISGLTVAALSDTI
jgi:hypothetical protein